MNDVINRRDDVINDAINFSEAEKVAIKAILRDPKLSAARLADIFGVKQRQDYQSVYIDLYDEFLGRVKAEKESIMDDIEFEMELVRQVEIPGERPWKGLKIRWRRCVIFEVAGFWRFVR